MDKKVSGIVTVTVGQLRKTSLWEQYLRLPPADDIDAERKSPDHYECDISLEEAVELGIITINEEFQ